MVNIQYTYKTSDSTGIPNGLNKRENSELSSVYSKRRDLLLETYAPIGGGITGKDYVITSKRKEVIKLLCAYINSTPYWFNDSKGWVGYLKITNNQVYDSIPKLFEKINKSNNIQVEVSPFMLATWLLLKGYKTTIDSISYVVAPIQRRAYNLDINHIIQQLPIKPINKNYYLIWREDSGILEYCQQALPMNYIPKEGTNKVNNLISSLHKSTTNHNIPYQERIDSFIKDLYPLRGSIIVGKNITRYQTMVSSSLTRDILSKYLGKSYCCLGNNQYGFIFSQARTNINLNHIKKNASIEFSPNLLGWWLLLDGEFTERGLKLNRPRHISYEAFKSLIVSMCEVGLKPDITSYNWIIWEDPYEIIKYANKDLDMPLEHLLHYYVSNNSHEGYLNSNNTSNTKSDQPKNSISIPINQSNYKRLLNRDNRDNPDKLANDMLEDHLDLSREVTLDKSNQIRLSEFSDKEINQILRSHLNLS